MARGWWVGGWGWGLVMGGGGGIAILNDTLLSPT